MPSSIHKKQGDFLNFPSHMRVVGNTTAMRELRTVTDAEFIPPLEEETSKLPVADVLMRHPSKGNNIPPEAYRLTIENEAIIIEASAASGFFYGLQTLTALLEQYKTPNGYNLPPLEIFDCPQYSWRGLHLDVSRHFFTVDEVKAHLDTMSLFKLNKLHFHLTDGPGWRIQINSYPQLTETGAWREYDLDREWNWQSTRIGKSSDEKKTYGGFYTQDEMKELVSYAAKRHIEIIPEIDIPGHSYAALVSYPSLACDGFEPLGNGLKGHDYLCMGKEESFQFVIKVLEEIIPLFPKETPIHLGGDELITSCGSSCKDCQNLMKREKLASSQDIERWFMNRVIQHLHQQDKKAITWDDAYEAGVKKQTVMCWRGEETVLEAINDSHPVILCPASHFYFDYYQDDPEKEPKAIGGFIPLEKVFSYTPPSTSPLIKGIQGNLWTEYIHTKAQLDYMTWPRGIALAERAWGSPKTSFKDFTDRMTPYLQILMRKGIRYRALNQSSCKQGTNKPEEIEQEVSFRGFLSNPPMTTKSIRVARELDSKKKFLNDESW